MKTKFLLLIFAVVGLLWACNNTGSTTNKEVEEKESVGKEKLVVYQVFTRLFGNTNTTNKPWGTLEENGVGKFNDFTNKALQELRDLGTTHIWYTGVPHHATITDYTKFGIETDDPDVVKGRAGSPYAVKDYYSVNPDLAVNPSKRMEEFEALIERTHKNGMKVIIDIVPNHVARNYKSLGKPEGVEDFGVSDDTSVEYARNNNFYYIPNEEFAVPEALNGYKPLGGEQHATADNKFEEKPAKWTGNGSRKAQPHFHDWYETVKINYGVRPDGTHDFENLPAGYDKKSAKEHFDFWKGKDVPNSWVKFKDIALFWLDKGVDGFRFDMAEMVPVEFWSYMNSAIKSKNAEAVIVAEVYQPHLYRDYIHKGKMDYLYDKVQLYDTLKNIMQGKGSTDNLPKIQSDLADIEHHMLHFLENHDEQRIASPDFAGKAEIAKPAMVVSTCLSTAPTMVYFGQEVGEPGAEEPGFGDPTRTSIFDYIGVPHHQRWMNGGKFDGALLTDSEKQLRDFYKRLLNLSTANSAFVGEYAGLHTYNSNKTEGYTDRVFAFIRHSGAEKVLVVVNFDTEKSADFMLEVPKDLAEKLKLTQSEYPMKDLLYGESSVLLKASENGYQVKISLQPLQSFVYGI